MKNKNTQPDGVKYKELIQRLESRRNQIAQSPKNKPNLVFMGPNPRTGYNIPSDLKQHEPQNGRARLQANDDLRLKSNPIRLDFGRIPNSAKNYRNQQAKSSGLDLFRRNKDSKNASSKQEPKTEEMPAEQAKEKTTKQYHYQQSQHVESSNEYAKLHQKLDSIQSKISEMKFSLQRKKEEKKKNVEQQKQKVLEIQTEQKASPLKGYLTQVAEHKELHTFDRNPYSPNHNVYYVSELIRAYQEDKSLAREHLLTSLQVFRMLQNSKKPTDQEMLLRRVDLPRRKGTEDRKTVVFDLDETLIHCNESLSVEYDVKLPITFPTGEVIEAGINIRPYCREILQALARKYEVVVFTASHSCYANVVLDHLDPNGKYIHHRLFREHCHATPEGIYIKDLRIINRELSDMVLVDNAAYSYAFQPDNGIPILPYYHGDSDYELQALQHYIERMLFAKDLRQINRRTFKLHRYPEYYDDPEKLVQDLYIGHQ